MSGSTHGKVSIFLSHLYPSHILEQKESTRYTLNYRGESLDFRILTRLTNCKLTVKTAKFIIKTSLLSYFYIYNNYKKY